MYIESGRPFYALLSNFGQTMVQLPKHMHVATATAPPETIVHFAHEHEDDTSNGQTSPMPEVLNSVNYKPAESRETHVKRHATVET